MNKYHVGQRVLVYDEYDECDIEYMGEFEGIISKIYNDGKDMRLDQIDDKGNVIDHWWLYTHCITKVIPNWAEVGD